MRRYYLLTFFLCFVSHLAFSQGAPKIKWQKCYGGSNDEDLGLDYGFAGKPRTKVISRDHQFFFVAGPTGSSNGDINASVNGHSDIWIAKTDLTGNIVWKTLLSGYGDENLKDVTETSDGSLLLIGDSYIFPNGSGHDAMITKLDRNGTLVWKKYFGGTLNDYGVRIIETKDKNYVFIGFSESSDIGGDTLSYSSDIWVGKISQNGFKIWNKKFAGFSPDQADYGVAIKEDTAGRLVIGANLLNPNSNYYNYDVLVAKLSSTGSEIWRKILVGSGNDYIDDLELTVSGEIVIAGETNSSNGDFSIYPYFNSSDAYIMRLNTAGNPVWIKNFGGFGQDAIRDLVVLPDNSFLCVGLTNSTSGDLAGNTVRGYDAWVFNVTNQGVVKWSKTYGGSDVDEGTSICYLSDNEYAFFGQTSSNNFDVSGNHGGIDLWLVRIGNSNTIKGTVFYDTNLNGTKEPNEQLANGAVITASKNGQSRSGVSMNGSYSITTDTGTYVSSVYQPYYNSVPVTTTSTFTSYTNTDSISFALQPIANKQDLQINILPLSPARPGLDVDYRMLYKNKGTTVINSGTVILKKDSRLSFINAAPVASYNNGDSLRWDFGQLNPNDSSSIFLRLKVGTPPAVNNGDSLMLWSFIEPVIGDETPADDTAYLKQRVVGSFDPNDKTESNGGIVQTSFITKGTPLQYIIRFQNTGSDTAFSVTVRDTLSNRVDPASLEMIAASHPYKLSIAGNVLTWQFNNILLPDQTTNEPASHGYIVYTVKPKADVVAGETIHNIASIYFDYNLPVLTNDASTRVQASLAVLPQGLLAFSGNFQNGTVGLFWKVASDAGITSFEVERSTDGRTFTRIGSQLAKASQKDYSYRDDVSGISTQAFFYRLKLVQADGSFRYSNVLFFRSNASKEATVEIYPNPVRGGATVAFNSLLSGEAEMQVLNVAGSVLSKARISVLPGKNVYPLTAKRALPSGTYFVQLTMDGKTSRVKFMVQ